MRTEVWRLLPEVVALGAYHIKHVWAVSFWIDEATKKLLALKKLNVKGRRCVVVDPQDQQVLRVVFTGFCTGWRRKK